MFGSNRVVSTAPVPLPWGTSIVDARCGSQHVLLLLKDDSGTKKIKKTCLNKGNTRVYGAGANNYGQTAAPNAPVMMGGYKTDLKEITFLRDKQIVKIACGGWHSVVLSGIK